MLKTSYTEISMMSINWVGWFIFLYRPIDDFWHSVLETLSKTSMRFSTCIINQKQTKYKNIILIILK